MSDRFAGFENVRNVTISNDGYHASPWDSLSNTRLKVFDANPQLYYQTYISKEIPQETTPALDFGIAFHEMVLEPHTPISRHNCMANTLAEFRPVLKPKRECDLQNDFEEIWFVEHPFPGIVRRSAIWGELDTVGAGTINVTAEQPRNWQHTFGTDFDEPVTAFVPYEEMHINGHAFLAIPDSVLSGGAKRGKAWTEFSEANSDRILFKPSDWVVMLRMRRSILHHAEARRLIYEGVGNTEFTLVGKEAKTGIEIRTRHDRVAKLDARYIVDLKTTRDADPLQWQRQCVKDSLHVQAAISSLLGMYHFLGEQLEFRWVAVDKKPPYRVCVFVMEPKLAQAGSDEFYKRLDRFDECRQSNFWYPRDHGRTVQLEIPEWMMNDDLLVPWPDDPNAPVISARNAN